jgi:nucleoside-diphosphate-sugar epimerase
VRPFTIDTAPLAAGSGSTAVVTGGAGFIGSRLCDLLRLAGWEVHSASRRANGPEGATRHWQIDFTDVRVTRELLEQTRPDHVFHLASLVSGAPGVDLVLPTLQANLLTTVNLLTALTETGCERFVVTGSLVEPDSSSADRIPSAPYAASKWASSDYVRMFHALYGLPGSIARVFMVYGPAQQDATKLVPYAIESLLRGEPPAISSGRRLIDWVYVDDVVYGLARLALADGVAGQTVDLGSGSLISTVELVERICELAGTDVRPQVGALADRPLEPVRVADVEATERALGWAPATALDEGLTRTIDWHRAQRSA